MVVNIECALNDLQFDEKMTNVFNTYNKYINYRFDYVIRTSINEIPPELEYDVDCEYKSEKLYLLTSLRFNIFILEMFK